MLVAQEKYQFACTKLYEITRDSSVLKLYKPVNFFFASTNEKLTWGGKDASNFALFRTDNDRFNDIDAADSGADRSRCAGRCGRWRSYRWIGRWRSHLLSVFALWLVAGADAIFGEFQCPLNQLRPPSLAIPSLSILRCRAEARMGHSRGACSIVCSRSRGLESMVFPAHRRGR